MATPITGLSPPTITGAQLRINTQPVSFSLTVFDPQNSTNKPLFSNLFETGVNVMGSATLATSIAGLKGSYAIKGIYSTKEGTDFSSIIPPPGQPFNILEKKGSYYIGFSFQQYLIQDPNHPTGGWGVFGEIAKSDGNPNLLLWSAYLGVGGSGLIPGRPDDRFGLAYFYYDISNVLENELRPVFNLRDESGLEIFYNMAVNPWFRVAANVQFIRSASGDFPRSIYGGLSSYVRF